MTSKEIDEILKSPITQSAKGRFISIEQLEQIKNKLKESEKQCNYTFSECIKEWEERGWELTSIYKNVGLGTTYHFLEKEMSHRNLNINITTKQVECSDSNGDADVLELEELELAIKTLKALEGEFDERK